MVLSVTVYGIKFTIRIVIAVLLPIIWRIYWHRRGEDKFIEIYTRWFSKHKDDHPQVLKTAAKLYAKMFYLGSWVLLWMCVLALIGILRGFGDSTSKSIWMTSSFIGVIGMVFGSQIINQIISGLRVVLNKYGGIGDQVNYHNFHEKGPHHHGWQDAVDLYSSMIMTDRYTSITLENDVLRKYAIENIDRDEFYHTWMEFPVTPQNRFDAVGKPGKKEDAEKGVTKVEAVIGVAEQILEDTDYADIRSFLADADEDDRKRIARVLKDLSGDEWENIRLPTVKLTGNRTALLRLPVRCWDDEVNIRHAVDVSGILDRFYT